MAKTTAERFWAKVDKTLYCWLWTGARGGHGYGNVGVDGRTIRAHRLSYEMVHGQTPDGLCVLHVCDTPLCVRPEHLFLGTHADNHADMAAKGRESRGETHASAKLSDDDAREIRRLHDELGWTQSALAEKFGVVFQHISRIVRRERWAHLP